MVRDFVTPKVLDTPSNFRIIPLDGKGNCIKPTGIADFKYVAIIQELEKGRVLSCRTSFNHWAGWAPLAEYRESIGEFECFKIELYALTTIYV
jgi:hypothetical protein